MNPHVWLSIQKLCAQPNNIVLVLSGSGKSKLQRVFGPLPVWLAAENGMFLRPPAGVLAPSPDTMDDWLPLYDGLQNDWMEQTKKVFAFFAERTPRSYVDVRETSLVWNYKYADVDFGKAQATNLL